ncbi:tRNA (N6-isopentenyl adenosine(37)-C2)-methylthiotransferase MiaB [Acidithrix sp. C25]|uniref:tRNA (N6-isopentenyl adenosine(37)-C2)-methylthiotransferase MiaB n=1 Tax=Acidithrix sp. C25 TaxID=1671482 RepID=UPI00191BAFDC|nr:tRNA (N6-isopentenyl adenosine(37)-C2)-methylthiotransferase MiaB [Acidithrix sp. C25]
MEKSFFVRTFGCQMNEHDSERISNLLIRDGYVSSDNALTADVVVLNTCCIRENADTKLYGNLGHLKAIKDEREDFKIVVAGCLAQKDRDLIRKRAPWVDLVVGTHNVSRVATLLEETSTKGPIVEILEESILDQEFFSSPGPRLSLPYSAYVTVQIGCDNNCAFCIVPQVRGKEISRPFGELLGEVRQLAQDGVTEITLLGQNVNSYGRDLTVDARRSGVFDSKIVGEQYLSEEGARLRPLFGDLMREVAQIDGISRVRFTSPHPKDLRPETIEAMASTKEIMNHLHFPLQSGSDRILALMHRGYSAERYLEKLRDARLGIDDLAVTTDIIVGFPGETEEDFEATLEVAASAQYDGAYTFIYSPRPGTEAAAMVDRFIAPEVISDRFDRLKVVIERSALARHEARIGRVEEVLVEGPSKKNPDHMSGRTAQNKLVHFNKEPQFNSAERLGVGSYVEVEITSATPYFLRGRLLNVVRSPRHRRKLQVAAY